MQSFQIFHFFFNFISPCAVLNHSVVSNSLRPHGLHCPARLYCPWNSPGNTGLGFHALLQGIFPTQGLNPGLLHCRWILYCLSHQEVQIGWACHEFKFPIISRITEVLFSSVLPHKYFSVLKNIFPFYLETSNLRLRKKTYSLMNSFTY